MNVNALLKQFGGNAETLVFGAAMHYFQTGQVETKHLDADAIALSLTGALSQLEHEHPGIAEKYGWARLDDVQTFTSAVLQATQATPPEGLQ